MWGLGGGDEYLFVVPVVTIVHWEVGNEREGVRLARVRQRCQSSFRTGNNYVTA